MKTVALVAGHFTPSNLAAVHRSRLWAQHLEEFGWKPLIVTAHHRHYEEALDWDLHRLVAEDLEVLRTPALMIGPLRALGDIGARALPFHYAALARLARQRRIDFVHVTIPSNYSALLGRMVHASHDIPYGIDYIDPWVHEWPGSEKTLSRAWASARAAQLLEPWAVRHARLITGVAPLYYEGVLERNPHLRHQAVTAAMPYGNSEADFDALRRRPRPTYLFEPNDGNFHIVYAGAMLPRAYAVLERLFAAVLLLRATKPAVVARLRFHFVGTGKSPSDARGHNVVPVAERVGVADVVREHPTRIPYVDVLNHLTQASAILVLGSTEPHYTPSKAFQAVQAKRPVLALLHEASTAAEFLRRAHAATIVTHTDTSGPDTPTLASVLADFIEDRSYDPSRVLWEALAPFSARSSAEALARALDSAHGRHCP